MQELQEAKAKVAKLSRGKELRDLKELMRKIC
jgi:hypothetical protein